jgi:ligand-binding sensor domain-containing protein
MLLCMGITAQQQRFANFSVKDGLAEKFVYAATQDSMGYMWFATGTGLYRYDGHQFKLFRSPLDVPGRSIGNILQAVTTDPQGHLWLGSFNALQWYNPRTNRFWTLDMNRPQVKAVNEAYIYNFTPAAGNTMFIATGKSHFFSFSAADSSFYHWAPLYPPTASKTTIKVIVAADNIWAIHPEGVYRFSMARQYTGFFEWKGGDITNGTYDTVNNRLLFSTWSSGLLRFHLGSKQYSVVPGGMALLNSENSFCVATKPDGGAWVGGYQLFSLDSAGRLLTTHRQKTDNLYNMGVSKICNLYTDREGNLWICSHFGLAMMPWQNNQVAIRYLLNPPSGGTVEPAAVVGLPNSTELLIANTSTTGLLHYQPLSDSLTLISNPLRKGNVSKRNIISLVRGTDGHIYAGDDVNFYRYLPANRQLLPIILKDQHGQAITNVGRNVHDNRGQVFMACHNNGFYIWHQPSGKLTHYNLWDIDSTVDKTADNTCIPTLADRDNNIWFTSNSGVYEYRQADERFYHHAFRIADKNIPVPATNGIAQDRAGHYWIATKSNGLYELYFDNGKEILRNYTQNSAIALGSDYLYRIMASPTDSTLWISGHTGLMRFDPFAKRVLTLFNQQQGLAQNDGGYTFNILPDGQLALLYYAYLCRIDLPSYRFNQRPPHLYFNSIKVLDQEYVYQLQQGEPVFRLAHNENFLQLEFTALSFNNSNLNQYAYQLEGVDKDWVYCGNRNQVSYAGLKPGTYIFRAKVANNDGLWGPEQRIRFVIQPPFYATWWFIAGMILLAVGLIYAWNRRRIAQVKKEEKLQSDFRQQIAETEMKALRAQMNPHFIFNSLNSIQKYILQQDHFAASQYLTRFSRLIRLILDHSNQNQISLASELELINLYVEMERLRFDNQFEFVLELGDGLRPATMEIPSMLIQPYLENAIWHGLLHKDGGGRLLLRFAVVAPQLLEVTVEDDGVGRAKAAELKSKQALKKKSYGMQITEDRLSIINRTQGILATCEVHDLQDADGRPVGTRVVLRLPFTIVSPPQTQ